MGRVWSTSGVEDCTNDVISVFRWPVVDSISMVLLLFGVTLVTVEWGDLWEVWSAKWRNGQIIYFEKTYFHIQYNKEHFQAFSTNMPPNCLFFVCLFVFLTIPSIYNGSGKYDGESLSESNNEIGLPTYSLGGNCLANDMSTCDTLPENVFNTWLMWSGHSLALCPNITGAYTFWQAFFEACTVTFFYNLNLHHYCMLNDQQNDSHFSCFANNWV